MKTGCWFDDFEFLCPRNGRCPSAGGSWPRGSGGFWRGDHGVWTDGSVRAHVESLLNPVILLLTLQWFKIQEGMLCGQGRTCSLWPQAPAGRCSALSAHSEKGFLYYPPSRIEALFQPFKCPLLLKIKEQLPSELKSAAV